MDTIPVPGANDRVRRGLLGVSLLIALFCSPAAAAPPNQFHQPDPKAYPDLFVWNDTCNVYVLRDGDAALLINLGDGTVLEELARLGINRIEWVLFTDHHREECQGYPRLQSWQPKIGAPEAERALFEHPTDFRKMTVRLGDAFTIHGASFVRPPIQSIPIQRAFKRMDTFEWHGFEFWCVDTRGPSPGAMSYLLRRGSKWLAFSGDLMAEGARMYNWPDSEWDYGFAAGVWALCNSASQVAGYDAAWLLPSHGTPVRQAAGQLAEYQRKLMRLERLLVRGYPVSSFSSAIQDRVSRPSPVPHVWQVMPHLFKFRGPDFFPNFYLLIADSGHALAVDCGLLDEKALDEAISGMQQRLGLKQIDAVIITHMHGDHFLQAPHLREKWGAQIWALDRMAPVCEHPEWFDYAAPIQAYGIGVGGVKFDRLFHSGEKLDWEGYHFTVDWMPGQTEFALCVQGRIDGRKVAFTGDNIFGDPADPSQTGHEAMVAHNSAILEEGYILGAEYLRRINPDILLGGHSYVMDHPAGFIDRYRHWAYAMRDAFRAVSSSDDYRYWFDPFWVRAEPYRVAIRPGETAQVMVHLRNFLNRKQRFHLRVDTPVGLSAVEPVLDRELEPEARVGVLLRIQASAESAPGVRIVAFDTTLDGKRLGERFDCIVEIKP